MTHHPDPNAAHPAPSPDTPAHHQTGSGPAQTDPPGQRRGMPAYAPQAERPTSDEPHAPGNATVNESVELPHQRDQHVAMTDDKVDPHIQQASDDLAQGRQDTSRSVEADLTYRQMRHSKP